MKIEELQKIQPLFERYKLKPARKQTKEQALCDEIYNYFSKRIEFPRLMYYTKNWGYQFVWEKFQESKKASIPALPLFLSQFKKTKIIWTTKP